MIKEKEIQLKEMLSTIIENIGRESRHADDIRKDVCDAFISRNLSPIRASYAMLGNLDLKTLTSSEEDILFLFLLTYSLNKAMESRENIEIRVEDYFTKLEVDTWKGYREEEKDKDDIFPIVFEDVTRLSDRLWQGVLSSQELNRLSISNIILYNFKTQRNPKITVAGERINLDPKKADEIKERLLDGVQYPDPIILNVLNNGQSRVVYNEKNKTLTVLEGSVINIVDGMHRKVANDLAIEKNPELSFNWQITFTFLSEKDAHDYMSQKDKQKPMKKEYIQQMDYSRPENLVVDAILDDRLSDLAKVMKDDDAYIRLNRALTKKSIIATAVLENYEDQIKSSTNLRNVARWIVEFTDHLMALYVNEFITNPYEIKEHSVINHKNMFYGYIALSAKLQNNSDWKNLLKSKMESIDFNKDNQLWRDIGILNSKDANKPTRNKLYKLFEEGINNGISNEHRDKTRISQ